MHTPVPSQEEHDVRCALEHLREARDYLIQARAPKAADKVRRALKSAEGAQRAAHGRTIREWAKWNTTNPVGMMEG